MSADAPSIALIAVTTNAAAAAGAIAAMVTAKLMFKKWEATMALNGVLAGLVSITCPCLWVTVPGALAIGAIGGVLVVLSVVFIDHVLKIDDPVGAVSVHGVCGAWGTLSLGFCFDRRGRPRVGPALRWRSHAVDQSGDRRWCRVRLVHRDRCDHASSASSTPSVCVSRRKKRPKVSTSPSTATKAITASSSTAK